jgi:hypothetical protein
MRGTKESSPHYQAPEVQSKADPRGPSMEPQARYVTSSGPRSFLPLAPLELRHVAFRFFEKCTFTLRKGFLIPVLCSFYLLGVLELVPWLPAKLREMMT